MTTSTLLHSLFKYKSWANDELFVELAKLDAEKHKTERHTAIRLMNHIYVVDRIFAGHLSGVPHGYEGTNTTETPTLEGLRDAVKASDAWYLQYIESLPAEKFAEAVPFKFTDGLGACMTREEMLAHVTAHGAYHRGAVGRIMAQVGTPPPRDLFTRYLHIAEPARRETA